MAAAASVSAFLFASLVIWQFADWLTANKRRIRERLAATFPHQAASALADTLVPGPEARRFRLPSIRLPSTTMGRRYLDQMQLYLLKAGVPLKAEEMVGLTLASGLIGFSTGLLIFRHFLAALLTGLGGLLIPCLRVVQVKARRISRIEGQLLDALVMMTSSLRAGHSFLQSIELVSREMSPPLSTEFAKLLRENRVGVSVEDSLTGLVERVESKDLELVVTGMLIQRQVGGNLAQVLENTASTIEKRIKTRARIRVATAQGRISAWVVSLLPVGLGFFVFGMYPDFGRIMLQEPVGIAMLIAGAVLQVVGILVIRKVVSIDV